MATAELVLPNCTDIAPALMSGNCTPDELRDETFLTDQIETLWRIRECHANAIAKDRRGMRSVNASLGQMLYNLKAILSRPGRNGQWSAWLKENGIARATADRLVVRFARSIATKPNCLSESTIPEPTEVEIGRLVAAVWDKIEKKLTTPSSLYNFFCCLSGRSSLICEYRPGGILVFDPAHTTLEKPETVVMSLDTPE
jgi:hypothetical protein